MPRFVIAALLIILAVGCFSMIFREAYGTCINDPLVDLGEDLSASPCHAFSDTYIQARQRFRQAAEDAGAQLHSIPITSEQYTTDVAILIGNKPGIVLHSSGVHGIEGYAGSAIQVAWLKEVYPTQNKDDLPTIVLIHAVNPHGMAHYRRWNENGVDLNRNGLHQNEWSEVLNRDPNFAHYEDFRPLFRPSSKSLWDAAYNALTHIWQHGIPKLKKALVTGQYHDADGIFFGGEEVEKSLSALWDFLQEKMPALDTDGSSKVTWLDVHTGLGKYGVDTISTFGHNDPPTLSEVFVGSTTTGSSNQKNVVEGYEFSKGGAAIYLGGLFGSLSSDRDVWLLTQEFGTLPGVVVAASLVFENEGFEVGPSMVRDAFYVQKASWRKSILTRGIRAMAQAITRTTTEHSSGQASLAHNNCTDLLTTQRVNTDTFISRRSQAAALLNQIRTTQ